MSAIQFFFDPQAERPSYRWLGRSWVAVLYLAGIVAWGVFLSWGHIPFYYQDWAEISGPRIAFVQDAIHEGVLPLHMAGNGALRGVTDRFLAIPDVILSPQMILLGVMTVGGFVLADIILLYSIGVGGLLWLRQKYALSPAVYTVLFLLFNFNGYITAHLSVGHVNYAGGYFLLPWFVILVLQLFEKGQGWPWVAKMAVLLFFVVCQGAFNQFVWSLLFLGLTGLFNWEKLGLVLKAGASASLLVLFRILPPVLELGRFDNGFLSGYPTLTDLVNSLVLLRQPSEALSFRSAINPLGWWELDLYVGLVGALFLVIFGIVEGVIRRDENGGLGPLLLPLLGVALLSIGQVYYPITASPIPLFNAIRVSSRMMILVFVFVLTLAALNFQRWLNNHRLDTKRWLGILGILSLLIYELGLHFILWRVGNSVKAFPYTPADLSIQVVGNHPDPIYFALLAIGSGISLLTAGFLILISLRRPAGKTNLLTDR